jgi:tetratricopeptide (TPR) repeat protein
VSALRVRRLFAAILIWILMAASIDADYRNSFRAGIRAWRFKQFAQAMKLFQDAIREEPRETGERITISGNDWELYLPHYYLGLAQSSLGNCQAALDAWSVSMSQSQIQRASKELANLTKNRAECRAKVTSASAPPAGPTTSAPPPTQGGSGRAVQPIPEVGLDPAAGPPSGTSTPVAPPPPPATVPPATRIETAASSAESDWPPALVAAARMFFTGNYERASARLQGATFTGKHAVPAELLRAASAYGLYVTGGERDKNLLERARNHVRLCRRLRPEFTPAPRDFSPRFIAFYRDTR